MLDWMKRRVAGRPLPLSVVPPADRAARGRTGQYGGLREYLQERHADRVVLTFAEIEDLVGFSLPQHARVDAVWWGDAGPTTQSDAWTFAGRTAAVNLLARSVVFDRDPALEASLGRR